jgi:hypothetical protein
MKKTEPDREQMKKALQYIMQQKIVHRIPKERREEVVKQLKEAK